MHTYLPYGGRGLTLPWSVREEGAKRDIHTLRGPVATPDPLSVGWVVLGGCALIIALLKSWCCEFTSWYGWLDLLPGTPVSGCWPGASPAR